MGIYTTAGTRGKRGPARCECCCNLLHAARNAALECEEKHVTRRGFLFLLVDLRRLVRGPVRVVLFDFYRLKWWLLRLLAK